MKEFKLEVSNDGENYFIILVVASSGQSAIKKAKTCFEYIRELR